MKWTVGELSQVLTAIAAVGSWISSCINGLKLNRAKDKLDAVHKDVEKQP